MTDSLISAAVSLTKREQPRAVVATALVFHALSQHYRPQPMRCLLVSCRGGVWGEATAEGYGYPVLRSTNMRGVRADVSDAAWRQVPTRQAEACTLQTGDILVAKSSGSSDLVGKATVFEHPGDDRTYLFSNFLLRLRPNSCIAVPEYLAWFLRSPQGLSWRYQSQQNAVGLRNLDTNAFLDQLVPRPPTDVQHMIVEYLDGVQSGTLREPRGDLPEFLPKLHRLVVLQAKVDALKRLQQETAAELDALLPSLLDKAFRGEL